MTSKERHEARYQRRKAKRQKVEIERANKYTRWDDTFGLAPLIDGYKSCAKASNKRTATQIWMNSLVTNARKEQIKLANGKWKSRGFNNFEIKERGKWRKIQSVHISEKGIQNSLCNNALIPILRPHLIYDNGASLQGKGTDFALNRFTKHLRDHYRKHGRKGAIYFYDFSGYFSNIQTAPLVEHVAHKVINESIMKMFKQFVYAFGETGLGLGSQVSQISAVFYPNKIDHFVKDQLGIHGYARYMDDGYIICEDIDRLKEIVRMFEQKCDELGIILNRKKCQIIKLTKQFIFLKTRFFITESGKVVRRIGRMAVKKERHRLRKFKNFMSMGLMPFEEIYYNFHSWLLSQKRGKPFHVWVNMIRYFDQLFNTEYKPPKTKCRRHKVLAYASLCATREV